jgi:hypothetical protein
VNLGRRGIGLWLPLCKKWVPTLFLAFVILISDVTIVVVQVSHVMLHDHVEQQCHWSGTLRDDLPTIQKEV